VVARVVVRSVAGGGDTPSATGSNCLVTSASRANYSETLILSQRRNFRKVGSAGRDRFHFGSNGCTNFRVAVAAVQTTTTCPSFCVIILGAMETRGTLSLIGSENNTTTKN
jgi:hypothetical protein